MTYADFTPIEYPKIWPPPEPADPARFSKHVREVLQPIADEIIAQLESRPKDGHWPNEHMPRQIAGIISDAIREEKDLSHSPALHPDDRFPLLFWGPFDDLTPLIVILNCRKQLNMVVPEQIIWEAWEQRWTVRQFIEQCIETSPS